MKRLRILLIGIFLLTGGLLRAQEVPEGWRFGGWEFLEVAHSFGNSPVYGSFYVEHDNRQYRYFDCLYTRTTLGVKILPWLSADVAYDFLVEPSACSHKLLLGAAATLRSGALKVELRERLVHSWSPSQGTRDNLLRSRLKVQYSFPDSSWSPYVAVEMFSWGDRWIKARHYVGCSYDITRWMQAEAYYIYYAYNGKPAQHILGLGLNFTI